MFSGSSRRVQTTAIHSRCARTKSHISRGRPNPNFALRDVQGSNSFFWNIFLDGAPWDSATAPEYCKGLKGDNEVVGYIITKDIIIRRNPHIYIYTYIYIYIDIMRIDI